MNTDLIVKVNRLFESADPRAEDIQLTVNHGELVQILTSLQTTDMYHRACEEALVKTVAKRKEME